MPHIANADLADFLDEVGWSPSTVVVARDNLARWERWLAAQGIALLDAGFRDLRRFLAEREQTGIGGATRHKNWQNVRRFYEWAARPLAAGGPGLLEADPMLRAGPPHVPEARTRIAAPPDAAAIVEHYARTVRAHRADSPAAQRARRDAALVSLLARSGLRSVEATGIDVDHLVRDGDGALVACHVPAAFTKSDRRRLVPLTDETPRLLERYLRRRGEAPGPLFLSRPSALGHGDGRMTSRAVQGVVRRGAVAVGVVVSAHDLRRGWAVASADRGVDRGWLKIIGGWERDTTMDRYLGERRQQVAVDAFHRAVTGGAGRLRAVE